MEFTCMKPYSRIIKPAREVHRNTLNARLKKIRLLADLMPFCANCGAMGRYSFDIIKPNDSTAAHHCQMSYLQRLNFYWLQHLKFNNVQVLCSRCNTIKNNRDAIGIEQPW